MLKKDTFIQASIKVKNNNVVTKEILEKEFQKWEESNNNDIMDIKSCRLRRLIYHYLSDEKILKVAKKYEHIYIDAVKHYLRKNNYTIDDLMFIFGNSDFSNDFFPDFVTFLVNFVMRKKEITKIPTVVFVKSGLKYTDVMKAKDIDESCKFLEQHAHAFYDSETNIIYFKEEKIDTFDNFMKYISHEISHAVDSLDASKGAFQYKSIQYYADLLYTTDKNEYKYNADEKSATKIGEVVGKNFTDKLKSVLKIKYINNDNSR